MNSRIEKRWPSHGTTERYWQGCRCYFCREAAWEYNRNHRKPRVSRRVSGVKARAHLRDLSKHGMGIRSVAAAGDVGTDTISRIRRGQKLIYKTTEKKILSVSPEGVSDGCRVDAGFTQKLLRELLEEGYTLGQLSRAMGRVDGSLPWLHRKRVWARTQLRVEKLYRKAMTFGLERKPQ